MTLAVDLGRKATQQTNKISTSLIGWFKWPIFLITGDRALIYSLVVYRSRIQPERQLSRRASKSNESDSGHDISANAQTDQVSPEPEASPKGKHALEYCISVTKPRGV